MKRALCLIALFIIPQMLSATQVKPPEVEFGVIAPWGGIKDAGVQWVRCGAGCTALDWGAIEIRLDQCRQRGQGDAQGERRHPPDTRLLPEMGVLRPERRERVSAQRPEGLVGFRLPHRQSLQGQNLLLGGLERRGHRLLPRNSRAVHRHAEERIHRREEGRSIVQGRLRWDGRGQSAVPGAGPPATRPSRMTYRPGFWCSRSSPAFPYRMRTSGRYSGSP